MSSSGIDRAFERRLASLVNAREPRVLQGGLKGVEKESLRVSPDGYIEQSEHPRELGSALTHEHITTDYSEALIELVTPAFRESWELLQYLCDLHQFVYRHLGEQLLWATSMPCIIDGDPSIPIARYGRSNIGRMKEVYRRGLGWRYGRMMQAISGVHYNYSFPAHFWPVLAATLQAPQRRSGFRLRAVLRAAAQLSPLRLAHSVPVRQFAGVVRLVRARDASTRCSSSRPARCTSRYATSLRMSDLGYRNKSQAGVQISVNSLEEYVRDLSAAVSTPHPEYERIGVKVDGEYRQLNANLLQIENEYYSYIRPKRVARSGERPTQALRRGGVEYVEFRALDVSAFDPVGVNQNKLRFLEAFAALCVVKPSEPIDAAEWEQLDANHALVAHRGREPGLTTQPQRKADRVARMGAGADRFDARDLRVARLRRRAAAVRGRARPATGQDRRSAAHAFGAQLEELRSTGESFAQLALRMSRVHKAYFLDLYPPNEQRLAEFAAEARESLERQQAVEAADRVTFDQFLANYFRT